MKKSIVLDSPARIHLGFLELNNKAQRVFGSIGLTISKFRNILKIEDNKKFLVEVENQSIKKRIHQIFKKLENLKNLSRCKIKVLEYIPSHIGLGSGTQISLAAGYLISEFNGMNLSIDHISSLLGRGKRSGIGIQSFKTGGFILDSGKIRNSQSIPMTVFNNKWPDDWKIILIFDKEMSGVHGREELEKFEEIKKIDINLVNINCGIVLMTILPAILEKNFKNFAKGIQTIQSNMSKIFYNSEKKFASKKIQIIFDYLQKKKVLGFGQSSWGPTGFIFCENSNKRNLLFNELENYIKLRNFLGISLVKVDGRNQGNIKRIGNNL
jgi:beta-RFAP synthase